MIVVCASLPDAGRELCVAGRARPPRRGPRSRRQPGLSPAHKKDYYRIIYYGTIRAGCPAIHSRPNRSVELFEKDANFPHGLPGNLLHEIGKGFLDRK